MIFFFGEVNRHIFWNVHKVCIAHVWSQFFMHRFRNGLARSPIMEGIFLVLLLFTKILFFLKNSGGFSQGKSAPLYLDL